MHIYVKNIRAKFHPIPNWNDEALGFLPKQEQEEQDE